MKNCLNPKSESNELKNGSTAALSVAEESPLEIIVNGCGLTTLMRTPGDDVFLVTGHLFNEGLIQSHRDIDTVYYQAYSGPFQTIGCKAHVRLRTAGSKQSLQKIPYLFSGGWVSRPDFHPDPIRHPGTDEPHIDRAVLMECHSSLVLHQPLYRITRGMHGAALYKTDGRILGCCEDVGRHNAMDKIIGKGLIEGWSFADTIMVFSGRGSLEMVLKTVRARVPVLVCTSAPTALAVQASEALSLTLVKPERNGELTIFTHPKRIIDS